MSSAQFPSFAQRVQTDCCSPQTLLLSNLFLLLNIQISTTITLFSEHSGDLTKTIKAEMIAMLCFGLVQFLYMSDMLIVKGLLVNNLTIMNVFQPPDWTNAFMCKFLMYTLVYFVSCNVILHTDAKCAHKHSQNDFTLLHPSFDLFLSGQHTLTP